MEKSKFYSLLFIYDQLKEGKVIEKDDVIEKFKINERTFYRYIKDFVYQESRESSGGLISEEVITDREKDRYILKGKHEKNLNEKEVFAISKVLLESRGFIKTEIKQILEKLLKNCICKNIECIIGSELVNYVSPQQGKELLKSLWQISNAIKDKRILNIINWT